MLSSSKVKKGGVFDNRLKTRQVLISQGKCNVKNHAAINTRSVSIVVNPFSEYQSQTSKKLTFRRYLAILSPCSQGVTHPPDGLQSTILLPLVKNCLVPGRRLKFLKLSGFFLRILLNASTTTKTASYINAAWAEMVSLPAPGDWLGSSLLHLYRRSFVTKCLKNIRAQNDRFLLALPCLLEIFSDYLLKCIKTYPSKNSLTGFLVTSTILNPVILIAPYSTTSDSHLSSITYNRTFMNTFIITFQPN